MDLNESPKRPGSLVGAIQRTLLGGVEPMQWGTRPDVAPRMALTARDLALLWQLGEARYLSALQLQLLAWGRELPAGRRRLKRLHDLGLMDKFRPPVRTGSMAWCYRITPRAHRLLVEAGMASGREPWRTDELHDFSYAVHDLNAAQLVLGLSLAATPTGTDGPLLGRLPFTWIGRSHTIEFRSDRRRSVIRPDATLWTTTADGREAMLLIEYDRTGRPSKQRKRLQRYERLINGGATDTHLARRDREWLLLYAVERQQHVDPLLAEIDDVYGHDGYARDCTVVSSPVSPLSFETPGQCWQPGRYKGRSQPREVLIRLPEFFTRPAPAGPDEVLAPSLEGDES